tara:strand:+ start:8206 stop:8331 length:126 start_codon:yes stop_codon:yes gene_type:complete
MCETIDFFFYVSKVEKKRKKILQSDQLSSKGTQNPNFFSHQ